MVRLLVLIGYRACGKSTLGRLVAARLAWPFADADAVLEERLGSSLATFFAAQGESAFRDREETVITELLTRPGPLVLATGGGAIIRAGTRARLKNPEIMVVWLRAEAALVQERLRHNLGGRMSLSGSSPVDEAPRIMAEREPWYRDTAGLVLDAARPVETLADELAEEMAKRITRGNSSDRAPA